MDLLPHYQVDCFETSYVDTRQCSAQSLSLGFFDFRPCDPQMGSMLKTMNCDNAFIIKPMDFKLHSIILDRSLHDRGTSDYDFRSCDPEMRSKIVIYNLDLLPHYQVDCFETTYVDTRSLHDRGTSDFTISGHVTQK